VDENQHDPPARLGAERRAPRRQGSPWPLEDRDFPCRLAQRPRRGIGRAKSARAQRPNKRKQTQIKENKMLSFTYVYFSESGLFNGLQPIQIKKTFPVSSRWVSNVTGVPFAFAILAMRFFNCEFEPTNRMNIAHILSFEKKLRRKIFGTRYMGASFPSMRNASPGMPRALFEHAFAPFLTLVASENAFADTKG
jgi:hypothetical protein